MVDASTDKQETGSAKAPRAALPRVGYSIEEAAEILGVSRVTLFREMKEGHGPVSFTIRGRRLFTLQALEQYAQAGGHQVNPGAIGVMPRAIPGGRS